MDQVRQVEPPESRSIECRWICNGRYASIAQRNDERVLLIRNQPEGASRRAGHR